MAAEGACHREVFGADDEATANPSGRGVSLAVAVPRRRASSTPSEWIGWEVVAHPDSSINQLRRWPHTVVDIAHAEAPLAYARLYRLVGRAAESKVVGRLMREQIDGAVGVATRRRLVATQSPFHGCGNRGRVLYVAGKQAVKVRTRGERLLDEIPFTELAAVAENVLAQRPERTLRLFARAVMAAYNIRRITNNVAAMMDRAIGVASTRTAEG